MCTCVCACVRACWAFQALASIDKHLIYWPKFSIHKAKQRFTRITQYLIKMRKLKLKTQRKLVTINKKVRVRGAFCVSCQQPVRSVRRGVLLCFVLLSPESVSRVNISTCIPDSDGPMRCDAQVERREAKREKKALIAAHIEKSIEKELLSRLSEGTYEGIYNFPQEAFEKTVEDVAVSDDEDEKELDESDDEEVEFVEDDDVEQGEDLEDMDDFFADDSSGDDNQDDGESGEDDEDDEDDESGDGESDEDGSSDEDDAAGAAKKKAGAKRRRETAALQRKVGLKRAKKQRARVEVEYEVEQEANKSATSDNAAW